MTQRTQFDAATDAAESPFVELLQRSGCARILDAFLANEGFWLTEAHLEDLANVDQSTVNRNINAFEETGLAESRGSHPAEYRFNEEHHAADALLETHRQLHRHVSGLAEQNGVVDSPFYLLVQTEGMVRILDALLANEGFWLTESHLENLANVDQSTVNRHIDTLEEIDLVRSQGSYPTEYQLNTDHPTAEPLQEVHLQLHRDISTLTEHQWEIPVPTAGSIREMIQTALKMQEVTFEEVSPSDKPDTADEERIDNVTRKYNRSQTRQDETSADPADNVASEEDASTVEIGYRNGPADTKLRAAEQIRSATSSQAA